MIPRRSPVPPVPRRGSFPGVLLVLLVAWTQASCSPADEPDDVGRAEPAFATATRSVVAKRPLVYLRTSGGTYNRTSFWRKHDDSRQNRSQVLMVKTATLEPASLGSYWPEVLACVKDVFRNIAVDFTETDPGKANHIEIVVTSDGAEKVGRPSNEMGRATSGNGKIAQNGVGFVFLKHEARNPAVICENIAHEVGHTLGLDHEISALDVMSYLPATERKFFTDAGFQCGEEANKPRKCSYKNPVTGSTTHQNSYQYLVRRVGTQPGSGTWGGGGGNRTAAMVELNDEPPRGINGAARAGGGCGFWKVDDSGAVSASGAAGWFGDARDLDLNLPVAGMASTSDGGGYWLVAEDGGVFAFGNAGFHGSLAGMALNAPIVGMAATPNGQGYWLVAGDGGVFAFGNAGYYGSTASMTLNAPIVGMAATPNGGGYWLVAEDGGVFAFGNAGFYGSAVAAAADGRMITGIARGPNGRGYWLVGADGSVYAFGEAAYFGGTSGREFVDPVEAIAPTADGGGYWLLTAQGVSIPYGNAASQCVTSAPCGTLPAGRTLHPGQSVTSCNGRNSLTLNGDGNLVLYRDGAALWATETYGTGSNTAVMQGDGNFVVYSPGGATWASGTFRAGSQLVVQDDGNVVIHNGGQVLWTTGTCGLMVAGQGLGVDQTLTSCDGRFTLVMQGDGNLVLYQNNVGHLWASWTQGTGSNVAFVQGDGNFVIYSPHGATWASGTDGRYSPRLKMQNDGNLVLFSWGVPVWSTGTSGH